MAQDVSQAEAPKSSVSKIRVVSWNLKWFPGGMKSPTEAMKLEQMAAAQQVLKELRPDILLLQEVADEAAVAELVSVLPGHCTAVVSSFGYPQNVAIATRLPVVEVDSGRWRAFGEWSPPAHGYAVAALQLHGKVLIVYSVHYQSNRVTIEEATRARDESSRQLIENASALVNKYEKESAALLIGGDFNTTLEDELFAKEQTLRMLMDAGLTWTHEGVPLGDRVTTPERNRCYDHLFVGAGKATARVIPVPGVSDHHPVLVELTAESLSPVVLRRP